MYAWLQVFPSQKKMYIYTGSSSVSSEKFLRPAEWLSLGLQSSIRSPNKTETDRSHVVCFLFQLTGFSAYPGPDLDHPSHQIHSPAKWRRGHLSQGCQISSPGYIPNDTHKFQDLKWRNIWRNKSKNDNFRITAVTYSLKPVFTRANANLVVVYTCCKRGKVLFFVIFNRAEGKYGEKVCLKNQISTIIAFIRCQSCSSLRCPR